MCSAQVSTVGTTRGGKNNGSESAKSEGNKESSCFRDDGGWQATRRTGVGSAPQLLLRRGAVGDRVQAGGGCQSVAAARHYRVGEKVDEQHRPALRLLQDRSVEGATRAARRGSQGISAVAEPADRRPVRRGGHLA